MGIPAGDAEIAPAVLLLGEANFSFTLALSGLLERPRAINEETNSSLPAEAYLRLGEDACRRARIVATCFEGPDELPGKYPETEGVLARLAATHTSRVEVKHGVNAWDLRSSFGDGALWDVIAWNHPHLGTEDCNLHRFLLAHFFAAALIALREGGHVVLSLVEGQEKRWELIGQAARNGLEVVASEPFAACDFPGYECKRNTTGKSFKNLHSQRHVATKMRSWTYHLGRKDRPDAIHVPTSSMLCEAVASAGRPVQMPLGGDDADPTSYRPAGQGLVCGDCGKSFSCAQGLRTHKRQVHELKVYGDVWTPSATSSPSLETCPDCSRTFRDAQALWQHTLAQHRRGGKKTKGPHGARGPSLLFSGSDAPIGYAGEDEGGHGYGFVPCEVCGMAVPKGTPMEAHLEALRPLVELTLHCPCGRDFVEVRALEQHSNFCPAAAMDGRWPLLGRCCGTWCDRWCRRARSPPRGKGLKHS